MRRNKMITYILFGLIAIGILYELLASWKQILVPLIVFGIVFYLYKYPPKAFRRGGRGSGKFRTRNGSAKTRKTTFYVINGNNRNGNDDEPPRYH